MKRLVFAVVIVLLASSHAFAQERIINQPRGQQPERVINQGQGQQQQRQQQRQHQSGDQNPSDGRMGVGVSVNQVDLRIEVDAANALDIFFNFQLASENFPGNNLFGVGFQFLHRLAQEERVNFHLVGGAGYGYQGVALPFGAGFTNSISLFGGVGAEYFLADNFSLEANVGLGLDFGFQDVAGTTQTGFGISPRSLTPGVFKLRYYF